MSNPINTERRIYGNARIDSPIARRIEDEYGEPLKAVLEGFAEQAPALPERGTR